MKSVDNICFSKAEQLSQMLAVSRNLGTQRTVYSLKKLSLSTSSGVFDNIDLSKAVWVFYDFNFTQLYVPNTFFSV